MHFSKCGQALDLTAKKFFSKMLILSNSPLKGSAYIAAFLMPVNLHTPCQSSLSMFKSIQVSLVSRPSLNSMSNTVKDVFPSNLDSLTPFFSCLSFFGISPKLNRALLWPVLLFIRYRIGSRYDSVMNKFLFLLLLSHSQICGRYFT